jgi:hypothetical protein
MIIYEHIIGRFLIWNFLFRGIMFVLMGLPCFVIALGGLPGILSIVLGLFYIFSWLRFEDGGENECQPCIDFVFKRGGNKEDALLYGGGNEKSDNDFHNNDNL